MNTMQTIIIDNFDYTNMEAMKYYSFSKTFKDDKKAKAKELVFSNRYMGARKMDGIWAMIIKDSEGVFHVRSRTKNVNGGFADKTEWIPHIINELISIPNGTVLIGEIYFPNNEGSRKVTSVFNCLKEKCLLRQEKGEKLHFYIFDIVAYNGKSLIDIPIKERIEHYRDCELCDALKGNYIETAKYFYGEELWNLYIDIIAAGGEGIIIQREDCKYLCGKKTAWLTLKLKKELEDTIDAFIDGDFKPATRIYTGKELETWKYWMNFKTGEKFNTCKFDDYATGTSSIEPITKAFYNNWASSISFSVMKDGKPEKIAWISGISDEIKADIVNNPDKLIGKVAELSAMMIEHIDNHYSMRHGRIEKWRDDKRPEDCDFSQIAN